MNLPLLISPSVVVITPIDKQTSFCLDFIHKGHFPLFELAHCSQNILQGVLMVKSRAFIE